MKLYICLLVVSIIGIKALTVEEAATWEKWSGECRKETGVSQEAIDQLRKGDFNIQDPKAKNQTVCFSKKAGLITEDGDLIVDSIKSKLKKVAKDDKEVDNIFKNCVVKHDKLEDTAFEAFKCIKKAKPDFTPL